MAPVVTFYVTGLNYIYNARLFIILHNLLAKKEKKYNISFKEIQLKNILVLSINFYELNLKKKNVAQQNLKNSLFYIF